MSSPERARLALALDRLPGVGRVTAARLLALCGSYDALRAFPREQVLLRLKRVPRAEDLVALLFDPVAMRPHLEAAGQALDDLDRRGVRLLVCGASDWPPGLDRLPRGSRPVALHVYGDATLLECRGVAFFARPPMREAPFELAQNLLRRLLDRGIHPLAGIAHGFDVVVHKIAAGSDGGAGSVLVAACGLARIERKVRPVVREAVGHGGALLSPFSLAHGPFEHDDRERALVQAALSAAAAFFEPAPGTPEWAALEWALEAHLPVFGIAHADHPLPPRVHPLRTEVDFEWVEAAVETLPP